MTYRSKVVSCGKLEIVVAEKEPYTTIKGGNNEKKLLSAVIRDKVKRSGEDLLSIW